MRRGALVLSALLAVVGGIVPSRVEAQTAAAIPRIAIGPFVGERAELATLTVADAFAAHRSELTVVSASDFSATSRELGLTVPMDDASLGRVGTRLQVDAVVTGEILRRGRIYVLRVRVVRSSSAQTLGTASWELTRPGEISGLEGEFWTQLRPYLRTDPARSPAETTPPSNGTPPDPPTTTDPEPPSTGPTTPPPAGSTTTPPVNSQGERTGANGLILVPTEPTAGLGLLWVTLSGGVAMRYWRVPVLGEMSPRGYENGGYPEARAEAGVLVRWSQNRAGAGAYVSAGIPLSIASRGVDVDGNVVSLPTSVYEVFGGVVGFWRPHGGGLFRGYLGGGTHVFGVDTAALPREQRLARSAYTGGRLGFDGTLALFARNGFELGINFGGEFRVMGVSREMAEAFGLNPAVTIGLGTSGGINIRLDNLLPGFSLRAYGEWLRYRTTFAGRAEVGTASDAVDDHLRAHLAVTYMILTPQWRRR